MQRPRPKSKIQNPKSKIAGLPKKTAAQKSRARRIFDQLLQCYPDAHCELDYRNPHELLVATILSAQATDVGVNKATPALFARFPTPADYARAKPEDIEPYFRSLGFFRQKAKSVHAAMSMIAREFGGKVPNTMDDLLKLRGVARKTANVVLGNAYGVSQGVVVDTHVIRLAKRLGLSNHTDPEKIERDLMALFPPEDWCMLSHLLIWHGRRVCKARNGLCPQHPVCREFCSNARAGSQRSEVAGQKSKIGSPRSAGSRTPEVRPILDGKSHQAARNHPTLPKDADF